MKNRKEIQKRYYEKHKEEIKEKNKQYYINNKDKISIRNSKYKKIYYQTTKEQNKTKKKEQDKIYRENNKIKIREKKKIYCDLNKDSKKKYDKEYLKQNKYKRRIRKSFNRLVDNWQGKRNEAEILLGYTFEDLKIHLSKFGKILDPNNHIDHILPISFLRNYITDYNILIKKAHDLRNLMLLPKKINMEKSNKLTIDYVPDFHVYNFFEYICELIDLKENPI